MCRFRSVCVLALASAMLVAIVAQAQEAPQGGRQRRPAGGRQGQGMIGPAMLLRIEKVQEDLKLTAEQKEKLQGLARGPEAEKQVAEILTPEQTKRLHQIRLQVAGPAALGDPEVVKALEITEEQQAKLREVQQQARASMMGGPQGGGELTPEQRQEMRTKREQARKELQAKLLEVLTPQQREKFEKMLGPKVEIDLMQMRPGGARQGRQQRPPQE
jgi:Spy/CpxP family protein refolding chaperone